MDQEPLSQEDMYSLDLAGYLIIRHALTSEEVQDCNQALDQMGKSTGMLEWPAPLNDPFIKSSVGIQNIRLL